MNKRNTKKFNKRLGFNHLHLINYFMLKSFKLRNKKIKTENKIMKMVDMGMM